MQNKNDRKTIIFSLITICLVLIIRIFLAPLIAGDEFINYYNTLKIYNGERMWEEVNIITTPFIYLLGCLFFKVFGTKFIVYRICNFTINILFFAILYKTFRNLNIGKKASLIYTMILEIPIVSYVILWGVTYNVVAIIFCLIGLNLNLRREDVKLFNLWQGLIILLIILTKHNIGLYYAIAQVLIELIIEEKWNKIINLIRQFAIVILGLVIFIFILNENNLLLPFVDMTIIGLNNFTSNIEINKVVFLVTLGAIVFSGAIVYIKKYDLDNKNNTIILSLTGIMTLFMTFPIADEWHLILGSLILYIEVIYFLDFNKIRLNSNKTLLSLDAYLIVFIVLNILTNLLSIKNEMLKFDFDKNSAFYLTAVEEPERINTIKEFLKSNDGNVLIISPEAGIFDLYLNLGSHGFFDEPFNGNLGSNQLNKMIEKLKDYEDSYILIHTKKKYIQEIEEFRIYINNNYTKLYEIEDYSVYIK